MRIAGRSRRAPRLERHPWRVEGTAPCSGCRQENFWRTNPAGLGAALNTEGPGNRMGFDCTRSPPHFFTLAMRPAHGGLTGTVSALIRNQVRWWLGHRRRGSSPRPSAITTGVGILKHGLQARAEPGFERRQPTQDAETAFRLSRRQRAAWVRSIEYRSRWRAYPRAPGTCNLPGSQPLGAEGRAAETVFALPVCPRPPKPSKG